MPEEVSTETSTSSWVKSDLRIQPISSSSSSSSSSDDTRVQITIASFNILAESYLTPRSHKLPTEYQAVVFQRHLRRRLLCDTIKILAKQFDVLCLQELDKRLWDVVVTCFAELGYNYVHSYRSGTTHTSQSDTSSPTSSNTNTTSTIIDGNERKKEEYRPGDGCAIFYCASKWKCISYEAVQFDDLAEEHDTRYNKPSSASTNTPTNSSSHALCGIIESYKRHNTALVVAFQSVVQPAQEVIVGNMHLYWNPLYEYVKLSQAHYLMKRVKNFADIQFGSDAEHIPVIICGDTNSKPNSVVHQYLTKGHVDARKVAPWHYFYNDEVEENNECGNLDVQTRDYQANSIEHSNSPNQVIDENNDAHEIQEMIQNVHLSLAEKDHRTTSGTSTLPLTSDLSKNDHSKKTIPAVRYILDSTLNKFTRWLRILGIDAELETREEEIMRTSKGGIFRIFERAREEKRTIITTSYRLVLRKDCPPGTYLVNQKGMKNLNKVMVNLLRLHGTTIEIEKVLSRCVICNGCINQVSDPERKVKIFDEYGSPDFSQTLDVYECSSCGQGYWWCDSPTSSASRVKENAAGLIRLCIKGGIKVVGNADFFGILDMETERQQVNSGRNDSSDQANHEMPLNNIDSVIGWLSKEKLESSYPNLKSAYAMETEDGNIHGERIPFTNVTADFVDVLDYILFDPSLLEQTGYLAIPTTFKQMNQKNITNGHLLPSDEWPSDHLAIGASFRFI